MPITIKRTEPKTVNPEDKLKELEQLVADKDEVIAEMSEQLELLQVAVDEIIFGGAL